MTNGNGGNMFSNFFSNLFSGNVSGMSMLGLVASAFLIFGRFGWMGKIAGALLGMMMIGNNATLQQTLGGGVAQQKPQAPARPTKDFGTGSDTTGSTAFSCLCAGGRANCHSSFTIIITHHKT